MRGMLGVCGVATVAAEGPATCSHLVPLLLRLQPLLQRHWWVQGAD